MFDFIEIKEIKEINLYSEQNLSAYPGPTNLDIAIGIVERKLTNFLTIKEPSEIEVDEEIAMCGYPGKKQSMSLRNEGHSGIRLQPVI
jgi:hypothetical protein